MSEICSLNVNFRKIEKQQEYFIFCYCKHFINAFGTGVVFSGNKNSIPDGKIIHPVCEAGIFEYQNIDNILIRYIYNLDYG